MTFLLRVHVAPQIPEFSLSRILGSFHSRVPTADERVRYAVPTSPQKDTEPVLLFLSFPPRAVPAKYSNQEFNVAMVSLWTRIIDSELSAMRLVLFER
jgi:hypothetical protein